MQKLQTNKQSETDRNNIKRKTIKQPEKTIKQTEKTIKLSRSEETANEGNDRLKDLQA